MPDARTMSAHPAHTPGAVRRAALVRSTRGHVVRRGLRLRRGERPRPGARRRLLATATSTGLVAPLLALDGLPGDLADPAGADWDALGPGSVVMAADVARAAPPVPTETPATHLRVPSIGAPTTSLRVRITPWVRAAGIPGLGVATRDEVRAAEEALGLSLGRGEVTEAAFERLRQALLRPAEDVCRALGLLDGAREVTAADVMAAATALEVPVPEALTPATVAAVVDAGATVVDEHLDDTIGPYARALGLDVGDAVDPADTAAVAAELGLELPDVPGLSDAERLHTAWLQTLTPHFERFGLDTGGPVDRADTVALARALGADVDGGVGPAELDVLLADFDAQQGALVPYATVGGATLHLPSEHVVRAGWHESSNPAALVPDDLGSDRSFVLPSRQRGTHSRSAIDIAVQPGTPVFSPVTGTVVEAVDYVLYDQYPDTRIRIRPDAAPGTIVTVLHVTGAQVRVGDHVEAGAPLAAHATKFPFHSQIDDVVGPLPHVHIEAKAG